jgi:hypothetical protein
MKTKLILSALTALSLLCTVSCEKNNSSSSVDSSPDGNVTTTAPPPEGKTVITVAALHMDQDIQSLINDFNKSNELYTVQVNNYYTADDSFETTSLSNFTSDLLTGKIPDIVIANTQSIDSLRRSEYLADMYPLMESCNGVKKEDFLPNVLESLETDGELNALFNIFRLDTAAVKASRYGSEYTDWTYSQAIEAYNNLPENSDFLFIQMTKFDLWQYMMKNIGRDCIDFENNSCDFSKNLPEVLEFLLNLPEIEDKRKSGGNISGNLINDTALVDETTFFGINSSITELYYMDFNGEDITYTGFPSVNGSGAYAQIDTLYAIMDASPNKEGAWEFLSTLFSDTALKEISLDFRGIPVTESAIHDLAYETKSYIGGSIRETFQSIYNEGEEFTMTDEAIGNLIDYIKEVKFYPYYDNQIDSIIKEEYQSVLEGEKSIEECVDILNSRINIFLSEKA